MIIRRIFAIAVIVLVGIVTTGCKEERKYKIGVSQCSQDDWRMKMNDEINRETMFHDDVSVEIRSADDDSEKQISDIRYFADNGFDIIIVSPNEAATLTPVIREVYESGMPVIIFDRNINGDSYTARIGADDVGLGNAAAEYALSITHPEAKAIEIYGLPGSTPAQGRHKGFSEGFVSKGGEILSTVPANWNQEDAEPIVDSLLSIYPDVDVIFAHNDRMAIGASESASKAGRNDIKIIGIDAAPEIGIKAVANSVIDATFLYPTEGYRLIRTALSILKDEPYEKDVIMPVSSAVDISNADILLRQDNTLKEETGKMSVLKTKIDDYLSKYATQKSLFYACIVIIFLLFGLVFMVLRVFWQHKKHQVILMEQNRELEEQRDKQHELNEKLQAANESKLIFFTNVSHDLRTPLTLISEPVSQLSSATNLTDRQKSLVKIADKNVRILKRLINQILDFRKYENDRLQLNLNEIDLGKAIEEWTDSFHALARKRNINLRLIKPEGNPNTGIAVDSEKMERVIFNLISNAFKYSPDGSDITVSYDVTDNEFKIAVADTGQGISERDLGNIFDRFFQVDQVHPNGSGIGLSLSKAFVEMHGGSVSVDSTLNKGSVFSISLPIKHIADKAEAFVSNISESDVIAELGVIENEPVIDENKPLVLIVDDNKDIRAMVTQLLNDYYNIITAQDGTEGIKRAMKYVPDLIICDIMMPGIDGLECCRRLKNEVLTSHIPVLMLTACSMDEQRVQGYDSGADGYLSKPFSGVVLKSRIASLIANRKRIKELWQNSTNAQSTIHNAQSHPSSTNRDKLTKSQGIDNEFYNRFLEIFNEEMGNSELSVDMLASRLGFERTQFYRKIKAITNFSPVELIRNLRLKKGQVLIKTTEKTMSEIAYEVGFSTPAYFTKCYREAFGETPSETRSGC
ncbi:MAG: substrate-binding domain-containing protein [Muribaculum sp.]|nr:substrate-binding domain-containing protein [Muribaculum sp.]